MARAHPLEGDGVQPSLFHHLWSRGPGTDSQAAGLLRVPETVVFDNVPVAWYHWPEGALGLRRRSGRKLERDTILRVFRRRLEPGRAVIASFVPIAARGSTQAEAVSYLDEEGLVGFLASNAPRHGILQKFPAPRGPRNEMVQGAWSPYVCLATRRINRCLLHDRHVPLAERALTFEGAARFSEERPCPPATRARVQAACAAVARHMEGLGHGQGVEGSWRALDRDSTSFLWLLFSSSFRFQKAKGKPSMGCGIQRPLCLSFQAPYREREDQSPRDSSAPRKTPRARRLPSLDTTGSPLRAPTHHPSGLSSSPPSDTAALPNDTVRSAMGAERARFMERSDRFRRQFRRLDCEIAFASASLQELRSTTTACQAALERARRTPAPRGRPTRPTVIQADAPAPNFWLGFVTRFAT